MYRYVALCLLPLSILALLTTASTQRIPNTLYISTDVGDDSFFSMSLKNYPDTISIHCGYNISLGYGYRIIYILDYNLYMDPYNCSWPKGFGHRILEYVYNGSTAVIGYNTLKLLSIYEPEVLYSIGIAIADDRSGKDLYIDIADSLKAFGAPERLFYGGRYHRFLALRNSVWTVHAYFNDGTPAIAETGIGAGRIILIFFNPVWPGIDGDKGYILLVDSIHRYLTHGMETDRVSLNIYGVAIAFIAIGAVSLSLSQKSDEVLRRIAKPIIFIAFLGYRSAKEDPLSNPVREKIYRVAYEKPYISIRDIVGLGLKRAVAIWHLEILVSSGLLSSAKVFGKTIYFIPSRYREAVLAVALESKHRRDILRELCREPLTLTQIAKRLGISKSTAKHHIDTLIEFGIVEQVGYGYRACEWCCKQFREILGGNNGSEAT